MNSIGARETTPGWTDRIARRFLALVDPYGEHDGTAPPSRVLPYLRAHLSPLRRVLLASLFATALLAGSEVWLIAYAGRLIDLLGAGNPADVWATNRLEFVVAAGVLLIVRPALQYLRTGINDIGLQCNAATLCRMRAHAHVSRQSVGWFQEDLAGRIASRLVDIGNHAGDTLYQVVNALAYGLVYAIGIVLLMAGTDARLAVPLLIWLALYVALVALAVPRLSRAQRAFQRAKAGLVGSVVDTCSNIDTLKLFSTPSRVETALRDDVERVREKLFVTRKLQLSIHTVLTALEGLVLVGFVGYGIALYTDGAASLGVIGAAIALCLRVTAMAEWMLDAVWIIFLKVGSLDDALGTVAQPLRIADDDDARDLVVDAGRIEISGLKHQYGHGSGGLAGIDLTVSAGEKIGLVGRSGAGKSTLVNLLLRFHEAEAGCILIDGHDIRDVTQDSLRRAIGMVGQQSSLLHRSVRDNIALGRESIDDASVERAARQAKAHDFIVDLVDADGRRGFDAYVGERGVKLSGGQRQRIALARAILKSAPILVLDEATSALDSEVEAEIQRSLEAVMADRTVIAIAHRLSTIAAMDRIVVMDEGRIVEQGPHEQLLAKGGAYAGFWRRQSGGFIGLD